MDQENCWWRIEGSKSGNVYKCQGIPSANQPADCRFYGGMDSAPVAQDGCERLHLGDDRCRVSSESSYPAGLLTKVDFPEPFSPIRAMSWWHLVTLQIPSGKRWHNYGKSPCYQWVNPLFLWQFSIAKWPQGTHFWRADGKRSVRPSCMIHDDLGENGCLRPERICFDQLRRFAIIYITYIYTGYNIIYIYNLYNYIYGIILRLF
jgi:hypothetical protein